MLPLTQTTANAKVAGSVVLLIVFATGLIAGSTGMYFYGKSLMRDKPFWTPAGKQIAVHKWERELNLSQKQTAELEDILDDFVLYYRNVLGEAKMRIVRILNEDQKVKFEKMLNDVYLREKH